MNLSDTMRQAWMGGSRPQPLSLTPWFERRITSYLFRQDAEQYVAAWDDLPIGVARTLWLRARYDAHAMARRPPPEPICSTRTTH